MEYILLCLVAVGMTFQNFMSKQFNKRAKETNPYFYSAILAFFAMIFFLISSGGKLNFAKEIVPYSVVFGLLYGMSTFCNVKAMQHGPISLTALLISFSLVIPTLYGIIILNDPIGFTKYIGIIMSIIAIVLINFKKNSEMKLSFKWAMFAIGGFLGNGFLTTTQKIQQMTFDGGYKSEFMIIAYAIVFVLFFLLGLQKQGDKKRMLSEGIKYAAPAGIANGMVNFLVMVLTALLPSAVLFPSISGINMSLTFIIAITIFRERLSNSQIVGYIVAIMSVILLNL